MTAQTEATATAEAPAVTLDEFGQSVLERLTETVQQYNSLMATVKAASSDPQEVLEALRDSYTEDDTVVKIRAKISDLLSQVNALEEKRDEILKPVVEERIAQAKGGTEGVEAQAGDLLKTINAGKKYLADLYGAAAIEGLPALVGKRRAGGGGGGSGQRRIRGFDFFVNGEPATTRNAQGDEVSNAAAAAKKIGVETDLLREKFFAIAGDDSKKYPAVVEFEVSVGDGDERQVFAVRAERNKEEAAAEATATS